jgi:hypothetical protein
MGWCREGRKRFFFEKKNQKTSIHWSVAPGPWERSKPRSADKSFLVLFFKKELLPVACLVCFPRPRR